MNPSKIPFYFINSSLVDKISKERNIKIKSEHILIISIVNSFAKVGKKCNISQQTFALQLGCSKTTIQRKLKFLVDNKILRIHYPKNQSKNHKSCITHLHKDVKKWSRELAEGCAQLGYSSYPGAVPNLGTNNKNMMDSSESEDSSSSIGSEESSFRNDSSSPVLAELEFLNY